MSPPILVCFAVPEEAAAFRRQMPTGVVTLVTGMGQANAECAVRAKLKEITPGLVLTCGFAGGLNPGLKIGAVVFSEDADAGLYDDLLKLSAIPGQIYCAPKVAVTAVEKQALRLSTSADAVEMESGIIRAICHESRIPSATIRVISDVATEDLPLDFNALMTPDQKLSFGRLALALLASPGKIPSLLRLQKNTRLAAENLGRVLVELLRPRIGGG